MIVVAKANVVEHSQSNKNKKANKNKPRLKRGVSKKQTNFQWKWFCDKVGHKASECRLLKKKRNKEANVMANLRQDIYKINLYAVVYKVKLIQI